MSLDIPGLGAVLVFLTGSALAFLAVKLCAKITGESSGVTDTFLRAVVSVAIFTALYDGAGFVIGWNSFDAQLQAVKYLAAVTGAGCYWIGSRK